VRVDLNADVGESSGALIVGDDEGLLRSITSASVAAGVHAGDPVVLRDTIRRARAAGVAIGAHPGLPDRKGQGRREVAISPAETEDLVLYQVAAVAGVAAAENVALQHVKLHGALYNMAARDEALAEAVARAVAAFDRQLIVFAPAQSAMIRAARSHGLAVASEFFADRAYEPDASLVPRGRPGALVTAPEQLVARALQLVRDGVVTAVDGTTIPMSAETMCIHSDTAGAARLAEALRGALESAGVSVRALRVPLGVPGATPSR
jgi:UPF0271 protein